MVSLQGDMKQEGMWFQQDKPHNSCKIKPSIHYCCLDHSHVGHDLMQKNPIHQLHEHGELVIRVRGQRPKGLHL